MPIISLIILLMIMRIMIKCFFTLYQYAYYYVYHDVHMCNITLMHMHIIMPNMIIFLLLCVV